MRAIVLNGNLEVSLQVPKQISMALLILKVAHIERKIYQLQQRILIYIFRYKEYRYGQIILMPSTLYFKIIYNNRKFRTTITVLKIIF